MNNNHHTCLIIIVIILCCFYDSFSQNAGLRPFNIRVREGPTRGKFYGYLNSQNDTIVRPIYHYAEQFQKDGTARVVLNNKIGLMNQKGELILPTEYDDMDHMSENIIAVKKNDKWGYVNDKNAILIPFQYKGVSKFVNGNAWVLSLNDSVYVINTIGERIKTLYLLPSREKYSRSDIIEFLSKSRIENPHKYLESLSEIPYINLSRGFDKEFRSLKIVNYDNGIIFTQTASYLYWINTFRIPEISLLQGFKFGIDFLGYNINDIEYALDKIVIKSGDLTLCSMVITKNENGYIEIVQSCEGD